MRWSMCHGDFATSVMSKANLCEEWKQSKDTGKNLTGLPTPDEQDALMAEKIDVVAPESVVAAVPTVGNDVLLGMNEDVD